MNVSMNRTDRKTSIRMRWIFVFFMLIAAIIVGKLVEYQINNFAYYQSKVLNQLTIQTEVNPERGTIKDRNGVILATNKTVYNVIISPRDIITKIKDDEKRNSDSRSDNDVYYSFDDAEYGISYRGTKVNELIAEALSKYLSVDEGSILEKASKSGRMWEVIKNNVDAEISDKVESFIAQYGLKTQVYFEASSKRYYPKSDLACHVIGFTNSDGVGIYGLEAFYNNLLEGTSGRYVLAQDAQHNNMPFEYERYIEAENGYNIVTTIDIYVQYELENQLEKTYIESGAANRVCGIVMDVDTGEILAMATYPSFDLNDP
ncbi:MAG: hypothetical protein IJC62_05415, partial [Clostridia bacterium]|nr:hypothetical protein [Clostridia bacterium]